MPNNKIDCKTSYKRSNIKNYKQQLEINIHSSKTLKEIKLLKCINKDKKMGLTPDQRKSKVAKLREEHEDYFQKESKLDALYIPKMAYRPKGKDELHVSFFPSELEKEENIYTEFVSIMADMWVLFLQVNTTGLS